jgi:site-specific recombinase XerD
MTDQSRAALLEFLNYLSTKGLMNQTTVASRKASVNKVLGILDESEAADVSKLDIDDVMARFLNIAGAKYTPGSLNTYKVRVKSAIDDFLRYQKDPLNFKPGIQSVPRRAERTQPTKSAKRRPRR